jgi:SAM-dependent methyltransferase
MLGRLAGNAADLGLEVATRETEAESLPFADESFDLVFGHAVLHHIPDLDRAAAEFLRVLRPGGTVAFCGEPSAYGDRLAAIPKRVGAFAAPLWRAVVRAPKLNSGPGAGVKEDCEHDHDLEAEVDVHAFEPESLRDRFRRAGFDDVYLRGEELLANAYGWGLRTVESTAEPERVPMLWRQFAFRSYLALQRLDSAVLEPRLPPRLFYNLVMSARKAAAPV